MQTPGGDQSVDVPVGKAHRPAPGVVRCPVIRLQVTVEAGLTLAKLQALLGQAQAFRRQLQGVITLCHLCFQA